MKKIAIALGVGLLLSGCAQPFGTSSRVPVAKHHHSGPIKARSVTPTVAPVEQPAPVATPAPKKKKGFWSRFMPHWHKQTPE